MKIVILFLILTWFVVVLVNFSKFNLFLLLFIIFAAVERFWETFIAAKQNILDKKSKFDWLFYLISVLYILFMYGTILEYLFTPNRLNRGLVILGIAAFFLALILRLCSIRSLGGSWNTCVLGKYKRKIRPRKLIKKGPYRFIRHPIYLGVIIESLSIPLAFSAYYTLGFVILAYLPLIILRAYLEEKELIKIFGQDYVKYKTETFAFFVSFFSRRIRVKKR